MNSTILNRSGRIAAKKRTSLRVVSVPRALSKLGFCSRKRAEQLIAEQRVSIGHRLVIRSAQRVDPDLDDLRVDGRSVRNRKKQFVYLLMNKPTGVITTRSDERNRKTVYNFLPKTETFLFPVGRLDKETSGALLVTNDSHLGERLTNPDSGIPKTYEAVIDGKLSDQVLESIRDGLVLDDGYRTKPATIEAAGTRENRPLYRITITEGKNRQIRRMFQALGYSVLQLHRISIGPVSLGDLEQGIVRRLTQKEIDLLLKV